MVRVKDEDRIRGEEIGLLFAQVRKAICEIRSLSEDSPNDASELVEDLQRLVEEINGLMADLGVVVTLTPSKTPVFLIDPQPAECGGCSYRERCYRSDYPFDRAHCSFWAFSWSDGP